MMGNSTTSGTGGTSQPLAGKINLKTLVGSGDKIGLFTLPFLVVGVALNVIRPEFFRVGGPSSAVAAIAWPLLAVGVVLWLWSVMLILTRVPKHELITVGPFALMKHPLYTSVGLLVIPFAGLLLNTWLGIALGLVLYVAARRYAPAEEEQLAETFGREWDAYRERVMLPWL